MILNNLDKNEYNPYYKSYIDNATNSNIVNGLEQNIEKVMSLYSNVPLTKHDYAYAEVKWTVKDILLHVIDTERIFCYRALRIARKDKTPLASFEQDDYVITGNTKTRTLKSLLEEYKAVRYATIALYNSFDSNTLEQIGEASGFPISVRAMGYIITGHENHHNQVLKERYL